LGGPYFFGFSAVRRLNTLVDLDWDELEEKKARQKNRRVNADPKMTPLESMYYLVFSFEGAIDLVSIIPFYVLLATGNNGSSTSFVRVCRIFRIFKVIKSYGGIITVFKRTFVESTDALIVMATIILVTQILFACILFAFEAGTYTIDADHQEGAWLRKVAGTGEYSASPFDSIPTGMYWAIVTLTTVGYGDLTPVTVAGRIIASLAAVCGIFCIALPVTVIGSNFSKEFEAYQVRQKQYKIAKRKVKITIAREKLSQLQSLRVLQGDTVATDNDFTRDDDGEVQLTDQQKKDIQEAFNIFDVDGSCKC
jgi:voltage-gated potassium channel Kch